MDPEEQNVCPNCKREIPAANFDIHKLHCARNIKLCPVCKEPVPQADLAEHHEKLHKLLPCKQCGEKVCGTDLEDHIRDSCGHTIKTCRFCELELPRRELPSHEGYCGARTEQCAECGEWVMLKYRQLHLDSNHGFLRLDDDPVPVQQQKKDPPKTNNLLKSAYLPKSTNLPQPSSSRDIVPPRLVKNTNILQDRPKTVIRYLGSSDNGPSTSSNESVFANPAPNVSRPATAQNVFNGINNAPKRTNDQPQINTAVVDDKKVQKEPLSRGAGAVKKRPAPRPPLRAAPPPDPRRDHALHSALLRSQREERERQQQNAYNLAHGLPPVLNPAAKLEKLRKMDALHNREVEDKDYKNRLQGRVWMDNTSVPIGHVLGSSDTASASSAPHRPAPPARSADNDVSEQFKDLKPMTPQEFMDRFQELQLRRSTEGAGAGAGVEGAAGAGGGATDRFSQIKSSLRELRRGLNEVTAPYNTNNTNINTHTNGSSPDGDHAGAGAGTGAGTGEDEDEEAGAGAGEVQLPCEFCDQLVPADCLVLHQTGCRPDLAQYRAGSESPPARRSPPPRRSHPPRPPRPAPGEPVIPCEFCTEALPVYLISDHQERCGRESNLLYAD